MTERFNEVVVPVARKQIRQILEDESTSIDSKVEMIMFIAMAMALYDQIRAETVGSVAQELGQ